MDRKRRYTGMSRTTKWGKRKMRRDGDTSDESSEDIDSFQGLNPPHNQPPQEAEVPSTVTSSPPQWSVHDEMSVRASTSPEVSISTKSSSDSSSEISVSEVDRDSSSEDFSSDLESFQAHYLEEEQERPRQIVHHNIHEEDFDDPGYPGDGDGQQPQGPQGIDLHHILPNNHGNGPDDPGNGNGNVGVENASDEDFNDAVASFVHGNLNEVPNLVNNFTKGEIIVLELGNAVRHNKTFVSLMDKLRNLNLLFGPKCFPEERTTLWNTILLNRAGMQCHIYCGRRDRVCGNYIGRKDLLGAFAECECGFRVPTNKARFFVTLNLRRQLEQFLCVLGMWQKLQYPLTRTKISPTGIEDIYDGTEYERLQQEGGILSSPYNFSYVFNTDGCNPTKKGSLKMWPIYIRINELPPDIRQKFHFVAAVYIDNVDPNFQAFMKPFVRQANSLSQRGITWRPDGVNDVVSKFIPLCHGVDSPARYGILNLAHWNSDYGCTYCTHQGVQAGGNRRYSFLEIQALPPIVERTHEGMQAAMVNAQRNARAVLGHKGAAQMLLLEHHDLRQGQGVDDLHQDHEGCAADVTDLLLNFAPRIEVNMAHIALLRAIDARLLTIKPPSRISRTPRSIQKRGKYSGTEWRNWLFFYSVPCLTGLLAPDYVDLIASLSYGCYLLSQNSIQPEDVNEAERLLLRYGAAFEEKFNLDRIKFNLHVTANHKANCVRRLGPPWSYSTYNFESLNMKLTKFVTSPKGAIIQVITRALLRLTVHSAQYDHRLQAVVRERLEEILNKEKLKRVYHVQENIYLVGKPTAFMLNDQEVQVLAREGFQVNNKQEYSGFFIGSTRYKSLTGQNPNIKSNDSFIYSHQDTFCTISKVIKFMDDNGQVRSGLFVIEHDVARVLPVARHISVLGNAEADLIHYLAIDQVCCPAISMTIDNTSYAVCLPNCFEID